MNDKDLNILPVLLFWFFRKAAVSPPRIRGTIHDPSSSSWSRPYQATGFGADQRRQRVWLLYRFTNFCSFPLLYTESYM